MTWGAPRFYTEVLGGKTIRSGEPTYVALANSWIIINVGGGPTDDNRGRVTVPNPAKAADGKRMHTRPGEISAAG
jgi:hypothetical protein